MPSTEQGVAMLSSVLNSERAIEVNIAIMRAFVQHKDLARKLGELEKKLGDFEGEGGGAGATLGIVPMLGIF